jgi:hypothetical protein
MRHELCFPSQYESTEAMLSTIHIIGPRTVCLPRSVCHARSATHGLLRTGDRRREVADSNGHVIQGLARVRWPSQLRSPDGQTPSPHPENFLPSSTSNIDIHPLDSPRRESNSSGAQILQGDVLDEGKMENVGLAPLVAQVKRRHVNHGL